jgi:hypothetical protein
LFIQHPPEAADQSTFPYISDIVKSSPSPNTTGDRGVASIFAEAAIPLMENKYAQVAVMVQKLITIETNAVEKITKRIFSTWMVLIEKFQFYFF